MADYSSQGAQKITKNLNGPQLEAVETLQGPLLILAGAGSGKTRVLTHRIANLIVKKLASPDEILAVTFTNKAAKEMEHRVYSILSEVGVPLHQDLWVSTFHSFCVRLLRSHIELLDYRPFFTIYDSGDQLSLIKKVMASLNLNDKMYPPKNFQSRISSAKMGALTPDELAKGSRHIMDQKTADVYRAYEQEMKKANALDFDDLLFRTYDLFRMYPDILQQYQNKFKYIMVDEYQDTNRIQYLLVQMLAKAHRNLCVVGDEDQSIYSWRGADISNILDFEKDFHDAKVIKLEENYRSTGNIVNAATAVIKNNTERKDKTLFTSNSDGNPIQIREENSEYDEARFVANKIRTMMGEGEGSYNDYAVFYRTNAQSRVLEEQLRTLGIPYKIVGGVRFYERMEIKDVLCYMKLVLNPSDDMAFKRIINTPTRGIGKTTVDRLEEVGNEKKIPLLQATQEAIDSRLFNAGTSSKLRRFLELIDQLRSLQLEHSLEEFYSLLLDQTEYVQKLKLENTPEAEARIDNLEELQNAISQFCKERDDEASLQTFLEEMALVSDSDSLDSEVNSVTLMTLHISKGLEYPYVFMVGLEENLFPSNRGDEQDDSEIEEERRLAYVGMTRARQQLYITFTRARRVWGQEQQNPPSRFLNEIPSKFTQFTSGVARPSFVNRWSSNSAGASSYNEMDSGYGSSSKSRSSYDHFPDYESQVDDISANASSDYYKGQRVRHPTFGWGQIYQTEGSGEQQKVSVLFSDNTLKKFVAKYARLERG